MSLDDFNTLYNKLSILNEEHHIFLVQNSKTKEFYVRKELSVFNKSVYETLLNHPIPGIPNIVELVEDRNLLIVIEEYIPGNTLEELLDTNQYNHSNTIDIALSLCDIVSRLHAFNPPIVHRDIKPSNIMLTSKGEVYLLDLNAAKFENSSAERDTKLLGTQGYAAPEQYGFGSSTTVADIYSIGMLINTLENGDYSPSVCTESILSDIIQKCTQLNPRDRYSSVKELKKSLSQYKGRFNINKMSLLKSLNKKYDKTIKFLRFLPPGFRSLNPIFMISSLLGYYIVFGLFFKGNYTSFLSKAESIPLRFINLFFMLAFILFNSNYLEIHSHLPLCKSDNILLKLVGILLFDILIAIIFLFVFVIFCIFVYYTRKYNLLPT